MTGNVITKQHLIGNTQMMELMPLAAAGYSLVYLLAGGGIFGAIVIFFVAKMLGK